MKKQKINIDSNFEFVIIASLRYAIGRRTYACHLVSEYIKKTWNKLSTNCQIILKRDLQYEIDLADRGLESGSYKSDPLGDKCDRETWINLNNWMRERIVK